MTGYSKTVRFIIIQCSGTETRENVITAVEINIFMYNWLITFSSVGLQLLFFSEIF